MFVLPAVVTDKVALLIGNKDYLCEKLRGLFYPETDTQDIAKALMELGFKVSGAKQVYVKVYMLHDKKTLLHSDLARWWAAQTSPPLG